MNKLKILFLYPNEPFLNPPPVGIGILNAIVTAKGHETRIFDTTFYPTSPLSSDKAKEDHLQVRPFDFGERGIMPNTSNMLDDLRTLVRDFKPHLVVLSVLETTFTLGCMLLDTVKNENPDIMTIAGGVFPSAAPNIAIANQNIDMICIGEGEGPIADLLDALSNSQEYVNIQNLWVKKDERILKNPIRSVVDINAVPIPDYSVFDDRRFYRPMAGKVYRAVPLETNRGCPYGCTFCNSPSTQKMYRDNNAGIFFRKKSIQKISTELHFLIDKWKAEYVYFLSDTFLAMTDQEFDDFIKVYSKIRLPFWMQTRAETITQERAYRLKEVGCHRVSMGLEHGNEEFRMKILMKYYKNDQLINASTYLKNAGIPLSVNNIIGFPDETRDLIFDTIELNRKISFDTTNAYAFTPFHGTTLYDYCLEKGYIKPDTLAGCLTKETSLNMPQLHREEILGLMKTFSLYARLPRKYWDKIKLAEKSDEAGNRTFEELKILYKEMFFS